MVGRLSAHRESDVATQVQRTIEYEQAGHSLSMGAWNTRALGIAADSGDGFSHYGEADDVHEDLMRNELLTAGFTQVDRIYDPYGTRQMVIDALDDGRRVVNYTGHGDTGGWITTRFSVNDNPDDNVVEATLDDFTVGRLKRKPSLLADAYSISAATGGAVHMSLEAGAANSNRTYLVLGSVTGTSPGFDLPGGTHVPLNWDVFTTLIVTSDVSGRVQGGNGRVGGVNGEGGTAASGEGGRRSAGCELARGLSRGGGGVSRPDQRAAPRTAAPVPRRSD
ncbi:MAG: C25 family cysteine peptidase [Planctomycetota bacterium]